MNLILIAVISLGAIAVSYTHLDVYKRQVEVIEPSVIFEAKDGAYAR